LREKQYQYEIRLHPRPSLLIHRTGCPGQANRRWRTKHAGPSRLWIQRRTRLLRRSSNCSS
ncbi:hypothetical protein PENTCL1PPCAC_19765, partial [Pristionchus entomophagus]